jgi:hypothetical protein
MRRKMRVMARTIGLGLFVGLTLLVQNASAVLPNSTYGKANGWEGYKYYDENGLDVLVVFDVYDTKANPGEFTWAGKPAGDQYIYAYQIASHETNSTKDVAHFSILDIEGNPILERLMHGTTALLDDPNGIAPDPIPSAQQGVWEWSFENGYIKPGEYSWFLVLSSNQAPRKGAFEVKAATDQGNPPVVPEPGMTALLGVGATMLLTRSRNRQSRLR